MAAKPQDTTKETPAIEMIDVVAGYGDRIVLDGITFSVRRGEIFTVIGRSGSGKSTLLKLCIGFLKAKSGRIFIDGEEVTHFSERQFQRVRPKMGMLFQRAALFDSLSVFENVAFPLRYRRVPRKEIPAIVERKLADVDMEGTGHLMPEELSGGMRKRVGLARALAENPSIILYDEPTTGLDPVITNNINKLVLRTRDRYKATSLVISHDMESVFGVSDRVGMLVNGRLCAIGTPQEIQTSPLKEVQAFIHGEETPTHLTEARRKGARP